MYILEFMKKKITHQSIVKNYRFNYLERIFFYIALCIITASSLLSLYDQRYKIISKSLSLIYTPTYDKEKIDENHLLWAKRIMDGGYILHFRHAERDKWIDVVNYDSLDSHVHNKGEDETRYPENDYFKKAVCLNERGKVQAKVMAEHIAHIKLPIGYVISSTSCRSRQTSNIVFDGFDAMKTILVHAGPFAEDEKERIKKLKKLYLSIPILNGKNTIVSAHNSVVNKGMFINNTAEFENNLKKLSLEEGGFFVISKNEDKLKLEHQFYNFSDFSKNFYTR